MGPLIVSLEKCVAPTVPSPLSVRHDGLAVYKWLVASGCQRIGVHGRSIGSVAACEIAGGFPNTTNSDTNKGPLSESVADELGSVTVLQNRLPNALAFLVVDRGLSSLQRTAELGYGAWASSALKYLNFN